MRKADADQTRPTPTWIEKQAALLRAAAAARLAPAWEPRLSESVHARVFADYLPSVGANDIAFNEAVTERALASVLHEDDPYLVAFLGSKIVERTFREHFSLHNASEPVSNLSVAKQFGVFFTPPEIALEMARELPASAEVFDPCCGAGALLAAVMLQHPGKGALLRGVELDPFIAKCAQRILSRVAALTGYLGPLQVESGDGLRALLECARDGCGNAHVILNPPYGRLRLTKDRFTNSETALRNVSEAKAELQAKLNADVADLRGLFPDETGILELSRLFFRLCCEVANGGGTACIISPDAWISSRDATPLRKLVVTRRLLDRVQLIPEGKGGFATVNQSLAITRMTASKADSFSVAQAEAEYQLLFSDEHLLNGGPLRKVTPAHGDLFARLNSALKVKHIPWIKNARGEIDQTVHKSLLVETRTGIPLIRGDHVKRFGVSHDSTDKHPSFIDEQLFSVSFSGKPKSEDFQRPRLVCRQCSYAKQKRRLIFARVAARTAIGNSCNYLVVDGETSEEIFVRQSFLLGVLNSAAADWFFRASNSNNHVANYEIDELPLPTGTRYSELISGCVRIVERDGAGSSWVEDLLEAAVAAAFGLTDAELAIVLQGTGDSSIRRATNYLRHLRRSDVKLPNASDGYFNNELPTLSALDRLIISHVPEGGNWQNIPESVPSERLKQIRAMTAERGVVRTTYYGRLRRDQPSYTINTYFNRPGNGSHIHPVHDRTLTSREAARLQSFPDSFIFCGPEGAVRDQIGNAVPPLLGRAVGAQFLPYADSATCIDMFCGAGGLSYGLASAGWNIVAAVDNNKHAIDTYCVNHLSVLGMPSEGQQEFTAALQRDLSDRESFEVLVRDLRLVLRGRSLDLLAGGPPCQGFSHAGFRHIDDSRNDLAAMYLHFAEQLRPKIFLLENVEGLATMRGGQVLKDLSRTLCDLGYRVADPVWKLHAEQYGVPQMRRRVFLVATLDPALDLSPPPATHARCEGRRASQTSIEATWLAPPVSVQEAFAGLSWPN